MKLKRMTSILLVLCLTVALIPFQISAATYVVGNGVTIPSSDAPADGTNKYCKCNIRVGTKGHWCCWEYGKNVYYHIWGEYHDRNDSSTHYLRNLSASDRTLTVDHLRNYLRNAAPGALLRLDRDSDPVASDKNGHTLIFVKMNATGDGAIFLEANYNSCGNTRLAEVYFDDLVRIYGAGTSRNYQYIKYICWPNAPAYVPCDHNYRKVVTPPTCAKDGYTTYTCDCGDIYTADFVSKLGHKMDAWTTIKEATAYEDGMKRRDCSRCDYYETDVIPAVGVPLAIVVQPKNVTANVGETAIFHVEATGMGLKYQWQWRKNSTSAWAATTVSGNKTATIRVPVTAARNGYRYRCVITDASGTRLVSNGVILTAKAELAITGQPKNVSANVGETAIFEVVASGEGLKYQWQWRANSSATWAATTVSGNKTAAIKVPVTVGRNGYQYRCVITDALGTRIVSYAVVLTAKSSLAITTQPKSVTANVSETVTFKVTATGTGLTYQWQWRKNASSTWAATTVSGNKTATITVPATAARNGYQYRCKITDTNGNVIYSSTATLTVN